MKHPVVVYFVFFGLLVTNRLTSSAQSTNGSFATQVVSGQLSPAAFDSLRISLQKIQPFRSGDTVFIQYQYATELSGTPDTEKTDDIIQQNVTAELRLLHSVSARRKNIALFNFAQPGPSASLLLEQNNMTTIDVEEKIRQLIFPESQTGSSYILFPDRKFIRFSGQDRWFPLSLTAPAMQGILNNPGNQSRDLSYAKPK